MPPNLRHTVSAPKQFSMLLTLSKPETFSTKPCAIIVSKSQKVLAKDQLRFSWAERRHFLFGIRLAKGGRAGNCFSRTLIHLYE